jgi:hypothetical protein
MNRQPMRYSDGALGFANGEVADQATAVLYTLDPNYRCAESGD